MSDLVLQGFEIGQELGRGGMATVWKARQVSLDRVVAIKILATRVASDPADVQRFQEEARAAARLKHPGIVQVYDASAEDGTYYFVMEYVAGYTVGEWARRKGRLTEKDALLVADCVAEALSHAWNKAGIVHCDIKPDNVMIDDDGTVKVTDLGLARTISAMRQQLQSGYVMGTPAYISPEQVSADKSLDFRADIYSLGAMLYQLVTGKMLFAGNSDEKTMALQINGTVPDPLDENPKLSHGICWLIERMLAKDRDRRYASWDAVREDIRRIKSGLQPRIQPLPAGASTIQRSRRRPPPDTRPPRVREQPGADAMKNVRSLLIILGIAAGLLATALFVSHRARRPRTPTRRPVPVRTQPAGPGSTQGGRRAEADLQSLEGARDYARVNPADYDGIIARFRRISIDARDDYCRAEARRASFVAQKRKMAAMVDVMAGLDSRANPALEADRFAEAIAVYEDYEGPLADATKMQRGRRIEEVRRKEQEREQVRHTARQEVIERIRQAVDDAVTKICAGDLAGADARLGDALAEPSLVKGREVLADMRKVVAAAADMELKIAATFAAQKGQEVTVAVRGQSLSVVIQDVTGDRISGSIEFRTGSAVAARPVSFTVGELDVGERLRRMGSEDNAPAVALAKGLLAMDAGATDHAAAFFEKVGEPLGAKLVAALKRKADADKEDKAKEHLGMLLRALGLDVAEYDIAAWTREVEDNPLTAAAAVQAQDAADSFRRLYGDTQVGREADNLLRALENEAPPAPGPDQPEHGREPDRGPEAEAPSEQSVRNLLLMRNRALDSKSLAVKADDGRIVEVEIREALVSDLSPLAQVKTLRHFVYAAPPNQEGALKDISPLTGLPLEYVHIENARLADIGALRGMPLSDLSLRGTHVQDISVLKGMPLARLDLSGTRVFDFGKLAGMPLRHLALSQTQLKNIAFLKGMPLTSLSLRATGVHDFDPLSGLPLVNVDLGDTQLNDLGVLKSAKLRRLSIDKTRVTDLSPLRGMPLHYLDLTRTRVSDFGAIRDLPLGELILDGTRFGDGEMGLLEGKNLRRLDLSGTRAENLSALRGMPLTWLSIAHTRVADVAPLQGMPLEFLQCVDVRVQNWEPLGGAPIVSLNIDENGRSGWFIRSLPDLRWLNGRDAKAGN